MRTFHSRNFGDCKILRCKNIQNTHLLCPRISVCSGLQISVSGEDFMSEAQACVVGVGLDEGVEEGGKVFDRGWGRKGEAIGLLLLPLSARNLNYGL
jgi:hypothetical protein